MADSTAMTIDFLRARLLSERSVSRASKERADQLAKRVVELEEQLRIVSTQRKKAEKAAAEVLAILESQGFGNLSEVMDSSSDPDDDPGTVKSCDDNSRGDETSTGSKVERCDVEDAMSGSELGGSSSSRPGKLSWRGRSVSPESHKKQKAKHLRQKHRRNYYILPDDYSPKYQLGKSCRKIQRKELRSGDEGEGGDKLVVPDSPNERAGSDCTDEQPEFGGEMTKDGPVTRDDRNLEDDGCRYAGKYEKDREMDRVLQRQAQLIGQYEAEENAQREWERKFNENRSAAATVHHDDFELRSKLYPIKNGCEQKEGGAELVDREVHCDEEEKSRDRNISTVRNPTAESSLHASISEAPKTAIEESTAQRNELDVQPSRGFLHANATVALHGGELHDQKDKLLDQSYSETVERSTYVLGKSTASAKESSDTHPTPRSSQGRLDANSDCGSSCNANVHSNEHHIINTPSVGSPLTDTPKSKISEWSSPRFQNHAENQFKIQLYQPPSNNVGDVLEALQRAKMSLNEKLSKSTVPSQEILALPAPGDSHSRVDLPVDDTKIPVGPAGLFRLPTDSFPKNHFQASGIHDAGLSLTAGSQQIGCSSNLISHIPATPSVFGAGSEFSTEQYYNPIVSVLSVPTSSGYNLSSSDFRIGGASFLAGILNPSEDLRKGMPPGDTDVFRHTGAYTFSNNWML